MRLSLTLSHTRSRARLWFSRAPPVCTETRSRRTDDEARPIGSVGRECPTLSYWVRGICVMCFVCMLTSTKASNISVAGQGLTPTPIHPHRSVHSSAMCPPRTTPPLFSDLILRQDTIADTSAPVWFGARDFDRNPPPTAKAASLPKCRPPSSTLSLRFCPTTS